ncbi:hypothetical protein [Tengunoibacter tsumagoiensis]|uniref:Uncharacterized protein n=1 Tax=Tengunoibacter tsumagoiensis TaxID=2014871 RepID=A0A401ZZ99_9CHLR|nr:hypothetical protein [Tengunoibacter tsumagoiensis]GCE12185.1 hypothetical protein KTT_20440 [Tengunoibacter tsumagoiensis]
MIIHSQKLRWLFWLRWKIFQRSIQGAGNKGGRIALLIIQLIITLVFSILIAVGVFITLRFAPQQLSMELLSLGFTGVTVSWILFPLIGFQTNEGLNLSKLNQFPLTRLELMAGMVISTFLDFSTLWLFFALVAVVAGLTTSIPLFLLTFAVVVIFYAQVIGLSQLILSLLMSLLLTRRFRDLGVILIALLSMSGYLCRFAFTGSAGINFITKIQNNSFSPYLQWFPPGMAAKALQQAVAGQWLSSIAWLLGLLATTIGIFSLWIIAVERALATPENNASTKNVGQSTRAMPQNIKQTRRRSFLPPQTLALALKDLKYFRRDPQLTTIVVRVFFFVIVLMSYSIFNQGLGYWRMIYLLLIIFFSLLFFSNNILGVERQSLTTLLLFPIKPRQLLWAKNLVTLGLGILEMAICIPVVAWLTNNMDLIWPIGLAGLTGLIVLLGCGNVLSLLFPSRMALAQKGYRNTPATGSQSGCAKSLRALGAFGLEILILLPVLAAFLLPLLFQMRWLWLFTLPLALLYALLIYLAGTSWASTLLVNRIPELLEIISKE